MKVKMIASMAGNDFVRNPGDICEVGDAEAGRLIEAGFAESEEPTPKPSTRKKKVETATEI